MKNSFCIINSLKTQLRRSNSERFFMQKIEK